MEQNPANPPRTIFHPGNILPLFLAYVVLVVVLFEGIVTVPHGTENLDTSWIWSLFHAAAHHLQ